MNKWVFFIVFTPGLCAVAGAKLQGFFEHFDYGSVNDDNIPGWYDQTGRSEFYNKSGDPNSPFDRATGSIGFHWNEGVGQYIYVFLGTYGGETSVTFSFSVGNYMNLPKQKVQPGEFRIGVFKNNQVIPADHVDMARAADSREIDSERIAFELKGPGAVEELTGKLDLSGANLKTGDRLYFRIQFTNPYNHTFNVDSVRVTIH
jgi:hypothetical protein